MGVKIYGDDLDTLLELGNLIAEELQGVPGAADTRVKQMTGLPIDIDRARLAHIGLNVADVQEIVEIAVGGKSVGFLFEGDRRFEILVCLPEFLRTDIESLEDLPIPVPQGDPDDQKLVDAYYLPPGSSMPACITLADVADITLAPGPNQISRENGKRRLVVTTNVRGRDIGSFVADAQESIRESVDLPSGYWIGWGR